VSNPRLSVVVCTFNQAGLLAGCLRSLVDQTLDKALYEVVVVNNNSTDKTQEIAGSFAAEHKSFRVLFEAQQGSSHARNCGWKSAKGDIVAYIDDDAKASPDWCERILRAFASVSPKPIAVGGEIHPFYERTPPKWFVDEFEIRTWGTTARFLHPRRPWDKVSFSGSNMAFQRQAVQELGGFSPSFGPIGTSYSLGEDTEFVSRVYQKYPLLWYDPDIKVFHYTPVRNMKISYRFQRAFKAGQAVGRMRTRSFYYFTYPLYCAYLLILPATVPFSLLKKQRVLTALVKKIETMGYVLGYLSG